MTVAQDLGAFIAHAGGRDLDEGVGAHAVRTLVDWTGAAIAGWRFAQPNILAEALREELGRGPARVLCTPATTASARTAALLNGAASHTPEMDDLYAPALFHPGSPTIAAALAAAQTARADGAALLRAIVVGYEVANRIGAAVQPAHYRFWHTTGTVGSFGAAAAAAVLLDLTDAQSAHALATVATCAAGLQQAFRSESMSKPLHAGRAAEAGLFAAQCAARGFTGEREIFEGAAGFGAAMSRDVDWEKMLASLGHPWTITETAYKNYACCGHAFAALDGALALRDVLGDVEGIRRVSISTYSTALEVAGNRDPQSPFEAKFSIPFTIATALYHGRVRLEAFTPERVSDARLRALMHRVEVCASETYDNRYPELRGATVVIEREDGRIFEHHQATRNGGTEAPIRDEDLDSKFLELAEGSLGSSGAAELLVRLRCMAEASDTLF